MLRPRLPALPDIVEPSVSANPRLAPADSFPLVLTCAKPSLFCQSQHRSLPSLRRRALHAEIELHPTAAAARKVRDGDWVEVRTLNGAMRAKARFNDTLDQRVVVGQHGWWEGCKELGIADSDPADPNGSNFNLTVDPRCATRSAVRRRIGSICAKCGQWNVKRRAG
jgi:anaerobic selenocysteine-containing dehydrogenase